MPQYKFTYFATQGFGEPIRYLFVLAGVPFEDARIPITADRSLPVDIKERCPWGQVPLLHVDGKLLAQSSTIFRYLAREFGFCGKDNFEAAKCDEYVDACKDFLIEGLSPYYREKDEAKKPEVKKTIQDVTAPKFFEKMEKIIKENGRNWLVGDKITWADLYLANFVEIYDVMFADDKDIGEGAPLLKAHLHRILALPQVKKFRQENPILNDPIFKRKY